MTESSGMNSLDTWDYGIELECLQGTQDLHLAAELGKTLLERNKELENSLKHQQNVIEDQSQEIEYLTKQTVALREVNDSRLRIYEQLEVNIQDLERANHRLAVENASDKKHIKSLTANIEALELKCEQLQSNIDDLTLQLEVERRRCQRTQQQSQRQTVVYTGFTSTKHDRINNETAAERAPQTPDQICARTKMDERASNRPDRCQQTQTTPKRDEPDVSEPDGKELEQISQLMSQLREKETQCARDQRKITEVEEQLEIMQEQNKILEKQLAQYHMKDEEIKSVQDELSSLEEVRLGQLCSRCLGNMNGDDMSLSACDDDDSSMFEAINERSQFRTSYSIDVQLLAVLMWIFRCFRSFWSPPKPDGPDLSRIRPVVSLEMLEKLAEQQFQLTAPAEQLPISSDSQPLVNSEIAVLWMMPATTFISLLIELCLYIKDRYLIPALAKSWKYSFLFAHYLLKQEKF